MSTSGPPPTPAPPSYGEVPTAVLPSRGRRAARGRTALVLGCAMMVFAALSGLTVVLAGSARQAMFPTGRPVAIDPSTTLDAVAGQRFAVYGRSDDRPPAALPCRASGADGAPLELRPSGLEIITLQDGDDRFTAIAVVEAVTDGPLTVTCATTSVPMYLGPGGSDFVRAVVSLFVWVGVGVLLFLAGVVTVAVGVVRMLTDPTRGRRR